MTDGVELTTALTNLFNALITLLPMFWCAKRRKDIQARLWFFAFFMFFIVCVYGVVVHGIQMSVETNDFLWDILYSILALMIGSYVVAVLYETGKIHDLRKTFLCLGISVIAFSFLRYAVDKLFSLGFLIFVVYSMGGIFASFILLFSLKNDGRIFFITGVFFMILASIAQRIHAVHFVLCNAEFNYNAIYHILTLVFVLFQWKGITKTIISDKKS